MASSNVFTIDKKRGECILAEKAVCPELYEKKSVSMIEDESGDICCIGEYIVIYSFKPVCCCSYSNSSALNNV